MLLLLPKRVLYSYTHLPEDFYDRPRNDIVRPIPIPRLMQRIPVLVTQVCMAIRQVADWLFGKKIDDMFVNMGNTRDYLLSDPQTRWQILLMIFNLNPRSNFPTWYLDASWRATGLHSQIPLPVLGSAVYSTPSLKEAYSPSHHPILSSRGSIT